MYTGHFDRSAIVTNAAVDFSVVNVASCFTLANMGNRCMALRTRSMSDIFKKCLEQAYACYRRNFLSSLGICHIYNLK